MRLNIYYSNNFKEKDKYKDFFIKNLMFQDKDILSGKLFDLFFYNFNEFFVDEDSIDIVLVDDEFVIKGDLVQEQMLEKWKVNKQILFIALSSNFSNTLLSECVNFIRAYNKKDIFEYLKTEIFHDILRIYLKKEKLKIFISHSKTDGEDVAKLIKEFIDKDTKLDSFFDIVDIQNSQNWQNKLVKEIGNSLFLFVYSDSFSSKEWTQKEILFAKRQNVPIVGIDVLKNSDDRVFPYIGNVKLVKLLYMDINIEQLCGDMFQFQGESNIRYIVNELLKVALKHYYYEKYFRENFNNSQFLTKKPELFDICSKKKQKKLIYPDPPLMIHEEEILKNCFDIELKTPILSKKQNLNKKIAISISEPDDLEKANITIQNLHLTMIEIARYLLIQNNTLIYGGDIAYKKENFNFAKILVELLKSYNTHYNEEKKLINYSVKPFSNFISADIKAKYKYLIEFIEIGKDCKLDDIYQVADNLTEMRKSITDKMDVKIALGGKIVGYSGFWPGVYEEIYLAINAKKPLFLIGGFGGVTKKVIDLINGKDVEELTFEYQIENNTKLKQFLDENEDYKKIVKEKYKKMYIALKNCNKINNLNDEDNNVLFESKDINEVIKILLKGIK